MNDESTVRQFPDPPAEEAYHGLAGDVVRTIAPHTEASPVALLIQTLRLLWKCDRADGVLHREASKHFMNLYVVLVGVTSMGRKGSSWAQVMRLFRWWILTGRGIHFKVGFRAAKG